MCLRALTIQHNVIWWPKPSAVISFTQWHMQSTMISVTPVYPFIYLKRYESILMQVFWNGFVWNLNTLYNGRCQKEGHATYISTQQAISYSARHKGP